MKLALNLIEMDRKKVGKIKRNEYIIIKAQKFIKTRKYL